MSAVVYIISPFGPCTGAMIGADAVLTAGHCLHKDGHWADDIAVYPARLQNDCPYGRSSARAMYSTAAWVDREDEEYDYGVIRLKDPLGNRSGWLGYGWDTDGAAARRTLRMLAYSLGGPPPFPPPTTSEAKYLQDYSHKPAVVRARQMFYEHDTTQGASGAPMFSADNVVRVVHTYGCLNSIEGRKCREAGPDAERLNRGTRITARVAQNLHAWLTVR